MTKRKYFNILMQMPVEWLKKSAATPSTYMTRMDVALHFLAIRQKSV
jgi:hypothetical protein